MDPHLQQYQDGSSFGALQIHQVMTDSQIDYLENIDQKYLIPAMDSQFDEAARYIADKKWYDEMYLQYFILQKIDFLFFCKFDMHPFICIH